MRILHLLKDVDWKGGIETYVLNLIPELTRKGFEQAVAYHGKNDSVNLNSTMIPIRGPAQSTFLQQVSAFRPDIIHVHNVYERVLLDQLMSEYSVVFTTHGYQLICPAQDFYLERPREICDLTCGWRCFPSTLRMKCMSVRPRHLWRSYSLARWAIKNKDRVAHLICPCDYALRRHLDGGFSRESLSVVPYFCELSPLPDPRPLPATPTITFLGRITAYKGVDYFIQILSRLPNVVQGQIIGNVDARNRPWLERMAKEWGVKSRLRIRNWVDRSSIRTIFRETSVFVFPSIWPETLGIVGLEALATGVPVVAFEVGGVAEWLICGETGIMVRAKDVGAATAAISSLINDKARLISMGRNGLELIRKKFSVAVHLEGLENAYSKALQSRSSS